MPIYREPDREYPLVLQSDKDKTPRPTFYALTQSMRGQIKIAETLDALYGEDIRTPELFKRTIDCLKEYIVRTENMPGFEFENLTYSEARELLQSVMFNTRIDHDEKKD